MATFTFGSVMGVVRTALGLSTDRQVSDWLGLSQSAFANRKKNQSLPLAELLETLVAEGLDLNQFFYGPPAGAALPVRVGDPAAAPVATPPITARHTATASPLPAAHLAMRESALRTLSAALDTLETLHAYEKQGLENGPQS